MASLDSEEWLMHYNTLLRYYTMIKPFIQVPHCYYISVGNKLIKIYVMSYTPEQQMQEIEALSCNNIIVSPERQSDEVV